MPDSALRQRKGPSLDNGTSKRDAEDEPIWLDLLRILSFLLCASCGLSYLISGGESFLWGMQQKPDYMRSEWWKAKFSGPIYLTPEELRSYDGSDASKPVYLAINGTIYDVSNGRQIYGPGGSYNFFAGVDASRAYVTGCFREDLTPDMRGVELMYLPLDDPATDAHWTAAEMAQLREEEMDKAKAKVHKGLKHWVDFFAKSKKYTQVGYLKRNDDWLEQLEPRELCASAQKSRKKRKVPQSS